MTKISIILPFYNAQETLNKTIDSIIKQSYKNIELICVDDGSTDNSKKIVLEYTKTDSRIKLYSKENTGVAATRNFGIEKASGEYIMFIDADDIFTPIACETALSNISIDDSDIGIFYSNITKKLFKDAIVEKNNIKYSLLQMVCWDKIYKKEFLNKHNITFKNGLKTAEDTVFCFLCMANNPQYRIIDRELHKYTISPNGLSKNINGLKTDYESFEYLFNCQVIQNQTIEFKLEITEMKSRNLLFWYDNKFQDKKDLLKKDIKMFIELFKRNIPINILMEKEYFNQLYTKIILNDKFFYIMNDLYNKKIRIKFGKLKISIKSNK